MDRFASGQTTNKFEVPLPSNISVDIANIQAACKEDIERLAADMNNQFTYFENNTANNFQQLEIRMAPLLAWHKQFGDTISYHDMHFANFIRLVVSNPIIRFLNFHILHWFTITITENRYPMPSQHDKYYAYIYFSNPEQFIDTYGYEAHKKEMCEAFTCNYKVMKTHLKKIKAEGYTLSNIRFRF